MHINIEKRYVMIILGFILVLAGALVYAYGTSSPSTFGHSAGEIEGVCLTNGTGCPAQTHVSGGLYGYCQSVYSYGCSSAIVKSPATCSKGVCGCPTGYTKVFTGGNYYSDGYDFRTDYYYSCYKN